MEDGWLDRILAEPDLLRMGHGQSAEDRNLGLGWLYYGLGRAFRPSHVVCIGSFRGFVPMLFARALQDNGGEGRVTFIDPSLVDDFWTEPERVQTWFARFGIDRIDHHRMTTQDFAASGRVATLAPVDLLFVDGLHTAEQARIDHETFLPVLSEQALVLFHDSVARRTSRLYGEDRVYRYSVADYMDTLKARDDLQVIDLPLVHGLTLVRRGTSLQGNGTG